MRQSEVRVRAGVEAWHLVKVHWLEYRFRVLWADFTFFLDTGSTQREARHSNLQLRAQAAGTSHKEQWEEKVVAEAVTEAHPGVLAMLA